MAAWKHFRNWNDTAYQSYRKHVEARAPQFRGRNEDCADLSMLLLIEFAAKEGLPVTLEDNDNNQYSSRESETVYYKGGQAGKYMFANLAKRSVTWRDSAEFYDAVKRRIGAEALWKENTEVNYGAPVAGDLLLNKSHCALVFRVYPPGVRHPKSNDFEIPIFPG